jgi:hypothetical protein
MVAVPSTGVTAVPPTGTAAAPQKNLWSFLCPNDAQKEKLKACFCGSQFGRLINNSMAPVSALTGGVLPQLCPALDPADLLLPPDSALGAAAQVKKDTLEAAKRRAAIRYMSTADCNWWPEVQAALANSLRMDRNECVRLEAALALQRGCCCNPTTVKALTQALSPSPTDPNPPEDSPRVRAAAMAALEHCLHCYFAVTPAPPPAQEQPPTPRKEGPPPDLPPPAKVPAARAEPPLRPVPATGPAHGGSMDQLVQDARLVLQKAKERQQVAIRAAAVRPHSLTELLAETFHSSATQASPLAAGQQTTPPPTIFGSPVRTPVMEKPAPAPTAGVTGAPAVIAFDDDGIAEPAPAPTAGVAGAPRPFVAPPPAPQRNPSLAPVAVNPALPALTPTSVAPIAPSVVPSSVPPTLPVSASPSLTRRPILAEAVSPAKTRPDKAPVLIQQTAATPAIPHTLSAWQLFLLLRNSTRDDVRVHAANALADNENPAPSVVQALVSSAGSDTSSEVRLACLKTLLILRVNDPALHFTLMRLQTDQDPRVRDAAKALHQQLQSRADAPTPPRS